MSFSYNGPYCHWDKLIVSWDYWNSRANMYASRPGIYASRHWDEHALFKISRARIQASRLNKRPRSRWESREDMMRKQFQNFVQAMLSLQNATKTNKRSYCSARRARCYQLFSRFQKHTRDATNCFLFKIKITALLLAIPMVSQLLYMFLD